MFSKAYKIASNYTRPVIISMRYFDKSVSCGIGSFVILNNEGWIVTVDHLMQTFIQFEKHKIEIDDYKKKVYEINNNEAYSDKLKRRKRNQLQVNQKWITNFSYWWGGDNMKIENIIGNSFFDLAIGKLTPFDPNSVKDYPIIKNPKDLEIGSSLCKLGYPFHEIQATFDEKTGDFTLKSGSIPVPRFPIEGIYTRNCIFSDKNANTKKTKFIETSSPGLRGQSGGAIFDTDGTLWAIQSRTSHLPLGFNPTVKKGNKNIEENQFLNVGLGVHPEILISFLADNKVAFQLAEN